METATAHSKKGQHSDVHQIVTGKIVELLEKGIVPWRAIWMEAGVPTSLISGKPYKGINVLLLGALGYERNLFLTSKQLKELGGSIQPDAKPHIITFWSNSQRDGTAGDKKDGKLNYYSVFNVAQCVGITEDRMLPVTPVSDPIEACKAIVEKITNGPEIRYKEPQAYYTPMDDYINVPKLKSFSNPASYYSALFHQLAHSTGHHTRLDRMGLAQMSEGGCDGHTQEELVAEIVTSHLENVAGIPCPFIPDKQYLDGWIQKFRSDRYFIFNACSLAQKALDFILDSSVEEQEPVEE